MVVDASKDRFWHRLVIPILWPVAVAQFVLLALCLVLGASLRWLMPEAANWSTTLWLLLGLLGGSTLNALVFLMLLKHRLGNVQRDIDGLLERIEGQLSRRLEEADLSPPASEDSTLLSRVAQLVDAMDSLIDHSDQHRASFADSEQQFSDDRRLLRQELARLTTSLTRAREESRLKSSYLAHVARILGPVMAALERIPETVALTDREELTAHLSDLHLLLENLGDNVEESDVAGSRVLIVDDGPVNLMLAREVLEREGLGVVTATSGKEALEVLADVAVDLVLMDIVLPDIDGVEACRRLRALEAAGPRQRRATVVALTANASEQDQARFRQAGMDDFLAKPYRPQALLKILDTWLPERSGPGHRGA